MTSSLPFQLPPLPPRLGRGEKKEGLEEGPGPRGSGGRRGVGGFLASAGHGGRRSGSRRPGLVGFRRALGGFDRRCGGGGRQCPPSEGVSASGHHRGQGVVGTSGRGSGEDQERAGLFVLHPEFGHLAGLWSVTGAHEGEQSALTWKPWPLCRQR